MSSEKNINYNKPILFFDGDCLLCARSIQFIMKHENGELLHFSKLGSEFGKTIGADMIDFEGSLDSAILYYQGKFHTQSEAILMTMQWLDRPFSFLSFFVYVPRVIRDAAYRVVTKNRIKWFGKNDQHCILPTAENQHRFLE